jgi:uncharacterized protein (TIGR02453 family)
MNPGKEYEDPVFTPLTLAFLRKLSAHNNRSWFQAHRTEYEEYLLPPLRRLVKALSPLMISIDPYMDLRPSVNHTISRIYRDIRFSQDKSPFRDRMWLVFRRHRSNWRELPAYFFELTANAYRYGMGFYCAGKAVMDRFRSRLENDPVSFGEKIKPLIEKDLFRVSGDVYKRPPNVQVPEKLKPWVQRKNLYLVCESHDTQRLFSSRLISDLSDGYILLAPVYHFLMETALSGKEG